MHHEHGVELESNAGARLDISDPCEKERREELLVAEAVTDPSRDLFQKSLARSLLQKPHQSLGRSVEANGTDAGFGIGDRSQAPEEPEHPCAPFEEAPSIQGSPANRTVAQSRDAVLYEKSQNDGAPVWMKGTWIRVTRTRGGKVKNAILGLDAARLYKVSKEVSKVGALTEDQLDLVRAEYGEAGGGGSDVAYGYVAKERS
jgi:hypothetical protein